MKTGIELIAYEREEQLIKHQITIDKDIEQNDDHELAQGAIMLLTCEINNKPEKWDRKKCRHMNEKSYKDRLIIAGALIAAEIDRLQSYC